MSAAVLMLGVENKIVLGQEKEIISICYVFTRQADPNWIPSTWNLAQWTYRRTKSIVPTSASVCLSVSEFRLRTGEGRFPEIFYWHAKSAVLRTWLARYTL
jgi:hypothetical protein